MMEKICAVCGKMFLCDTDRWAYKMKPSYKKNSYLCSWSCMQKARENGTEMKKTKHG